MRVIVFFDLPVDNAKLRRQYSKFRKFLINEGFIMMQESVYSKLALNGSVVASIKEKLNKNRPKYGLVQMLIITEKQYSRIEFITGQSENKTLNNTDRTVIM